MESSSKSLEQELKMLGETLQHLSSLMQQCYKSMQPFWLGYVNVFCRHKSQHNFKKKDRCGLECFNFVGNRVYLNDRLKVMMMEELVWKQSSKGLCRKRDYWYHNIVADICVSRSVVIHLIIIATYKPMKVCYCAKQCCLIYQK